MRAVVTGGAGFIGSHVVDGLVQSGADVLVVDNLSRGRRSNLQRPLRDGAQLAEIDIRDAEAVESAFNEFRPDVVFHLAAQIDVRHSMAEPAGDASINVLGSINVFAAAHAAGAERVINTSTGGAIYSEGATVPTAESEPTEPVSAYGLSKRTVERYAAWFRRTRGLQVTTLRYGNVYGPRQDPRGDAGVIALFCDRALAGRRPLVFGDGRQTRDYVFVGDVATANLAACCAGALPHGEYNVGTGTEISVLELAVEVAEVAGLEAGAFEPEFQPARAGELARSCLDVSRARHDLQLPPPVPLTEGLRRTLDWIRGL